MHEACFFFIYAIVIQNPQPHSLLTRNFFWFIYVVSLSNCGLVVPMLFSHQYRHSLFPSRGNFLTSSWLQHGDKDSTMHMDSNLALQHHIPNSKVSPVHCTFSRILSKLPPNHSTIIQIEVNTLSSLFSISTSHRCPFNIRHWGPHLPYFPHQIMLLMSVFQTFTIVMVAMLILINSQALTNELIMLISLAHVKPRRHGVVAAI